MNVYLHAYFVCFQKESLKIYRIGISSIISKISTLGGELGLLARSNTPSIVFVKYFETRLREFIHYRKYQQIVAAWGGKLNQLGKFSTQWVDHNLPKWLHVLENENLKDKPLAILEIGSWEGRSACFFLSHLSRSSLVAVDTWQGGDEHQGDSQLETIEQRFDTNVQSFGNRVKKYKGTSFSFFVSQPKSEQFDLIYVDGSHYVDDVICDAVKAFKLLKLGGILIFDDYTWNFYENPRRNPAGAINAFLQMKKGEYNLVAVYNQLILKKTGGVAD